MKNTKNIATKILSIFLVVVIGFMPGSRSRVYAEENNPPVVPFEFIDAHADTITRAMDRNQSLFRNNLHLDFERLSQFEAPVQVFAIWVADRFLWDAFNYANSAIDFFERELAAHSDIIELALSIEDLERNARNGKISAILSLEGGEPLQGNLDNIDHFFNRGVRMIAPTWDRETDLGYGIGTGINRGLKPFGIESIRRMNELGIIIDVTHLNEAGFWDVHYLSTQPYIASHSNAFSIVPHRQNLNDYQIRAMVERGGLIALCFFPPFLSGQRNADKGHIMRHIDHFISLGAINNIGLGVDLDGVPNLPYGVRDVLSLRDFAQALTAEYGHETSRAIMAGNFYNFLRTVEWGSPRPNYIYDEFGPEESVIPPYEMRRRISVLMIRLREQKLPR